MLSIGFSCPSGHKMLFSVGQEQNANQNAEWHWQFGTDLLRLCF